MPAIQPRCRSGVSRSVSLSLDPIQSQQWLWCLHRHQCSRRKKMNDENQENDRPVILTIPASLTVPGFGFLVALNPNWCFTWQERKASSALSVWSRLFVCARRATSSHQKPFEFRIAQKKTGRRWTEYDQAERSSCERSRNRLLRLRAYQ